MYMLVFRLIGDYVIGCVCACCWLARASVRWSSCRTISRGLQL